ncbi:alpha kinase/elongation factor 2 kinase [Anaeramoeba flamelloides]|uniref:Alpha kinase/elongation factor 2 kinase n=1 Tax=Anaeramoeba flamelloides TaxID=1746091 RepID=A0ABQ8YJB7_9EUKA|nr:alpha kinase/elongation factor 2 kinase [Anaeramoeba flamelloides]
MFSVDNVSRNQINTPDMEKIKLDPKDQNYKTKTIILFKKRGNQNKWKPILFGKSAERKYLGLRNNEIDNYQLFKYFKMKLYQNDSLNPKIRSYSGKKWKFIKVLACLFRFIYQKFVESVKNSNNKIKVDKDKIQWVLTVPAIWEDQAKEIMRRAFYKAGLISEKNSSHLLFCYEPEVAALDFFQDQRNNLDELNNKKLLVVDAGGGTIDITLMKATIENNKIKEFEILMVPKGGDFGSIYIDQEFMKFFQSFLNLNDNQFNQFKNECSRGILKILNMWEDIKIGTQIGDLTEKKENVIEIPNIIIKYLKKNFGIKDFEGLADQFNERNQNSVLSEIEWNEDEDQLKIKGDRIKSFFKEPIDKLKEYLNNLRQTSEILKQTDIVFFTGGLSNCDYFRKIVQKQLGKNCQYFLSPYPDKSIVIGAVLFGFDPNIVATRRSQFTYGILHKPIFNPQIHDPKRKETIKNSNNQSIERCRNVIQPFIFKGDTIKLSEPIIKKHNPLKENQKKIIFKIIRCEKKWDPNYKSVYSDSPGAKIMGSVIIEIPESNLAYVQKKVGVSFHFATTEIQIFMKYLPDPRIRKKLSLNYVDN